ncbi:MAG: hypothetical protein QXY75_05870, partial [Candidatus Bathyarchaeia archaeon]
MVEVQSWVLSRYERLWSAFGDRRFTRDEAVDVLRRFEGSAFSEDSVNVLLSEMRRAGLLV